MSNRSFPISGIPHIPSNEVLADTFFRKMRGGSQSSLIGASDGNFYVVKLAGNPQGPNILFNEAFGSILAEHLGLPVPEWRPIQIGSDFIETNANLGFALAEEGPQPSSGRHFGSRFVVGSEDEPVYEVVPLRWMDRVENAHFFAGALLLDIWTENVDRRQVLFIEHLESRALDVRFFDHGHMFGGPHGGKRLKSPRSCLYHHWNIYQRAFASESVEKWLLSIEAMDETILQAMVESVPCEWRNPVVEKNAIALLINNQQTVRSKAKEIVDRHPLN